jgi:hypothetical protein
MKIKNFLLVVKKNKMLCMDRVLSARGRFVPIKLFPHFKSLECRKEKCTGVNIANKNNN